MSDRTIPMTLPLDSAGFMRRECPSCERQFKWYPTQPQTGDVRDTDDLGSDVHDETQDEVPTPEHYYCPYCHETAVLTAWWTREQLEYARELTASEVVGPKLRDFADRLSGLNHSRGLISMSVNVDTSNLARPEPLREPDDMVRVDFPCHPEEPVKVDDGWEGDVACLVCGIRYPIDIVRELPESS